MAGQSPHSVEIERSTKCSGGLVHYYRIVGGDHDPRSRAPNASQLLFDSFRDEVRHTSPADVEGTNTRRTYKYRLVAASVAEILLYDRSRDISAGSTCSPEEEFARRGHAGDWVSLMNIIKADCQ